MLETNITFKQNPIIRGFFKDNNNINDKDFKNAETNIKSINKSFSLLNNFDLDILNYLYYVTQQKYFNYQAITYTNKNNLSLSFLEIKKKLNIKHKGFKQEIKNSLENIYNISLYLKNFKCPITGNLIELQRTRIISSVTYLADTVEIEFTKLFMLNVLRHTNQKVNKKIGNFTAIDTKTTLDIKSKFGKRLYEYLISFQGQGQRNHLCLNIPDLNQLFGLNYKELSRFKSILERCYPKVFKHLNFSYKIEKADKKICFEFYIN